MFLLNSSLLSLFSVARRFKQCNRQLLQKYAAYFPEAVLMAPEAGPGGDESGISSMFCWEVPNTEGF